MVIELSVKRTGNRPWWDELDWLDKKGYKPAHNGLDARAAESITCPRCAQRQMDYRGFTILGVVHRSYALCDMCEHWFEF
jgi:hypothetical protein